MAESKEERAPAVPESNGLVVKKDLDQVLTELGFGWYQITLVLICCVGNLADAMEVTLLSFLSPCAEVEFGLSDFQTSFLTGIVFVGEVLGALIFGKLADHKGRRYAYVIALVVIVVFGVLTFFTTTYTELVICRGCAGLGLGAGLVPFDYVSETVPASMRGMACMLNGVCWGLGSMFTAGMAWLFLDDYGWRFLALMCTMVPLAALLAVFTITESPRWLLNQGRAEEATKAVQVAAKRNGIDLGDFSLNAYPSPPGHEEGKIAEMFKGSLRRPTALLSLLWLVHGFTYYAIVLMISDIFEENDGCSFSYSDIFTSTASEPVMVFLAVFYIDLSRRWANAANYALAAIAMVFLGVSFGSITVTAVLAFIARGTIRAASAATWTLTPELYPTEIRTSTHAVFYVISRTGAYASAYIVYTSLTDEEIDIVIAAITACGVILSLAFEETAGLSLDEMQIPTPDRPKQRKKYGNGAFFQRKKPADSREESLIANVA